MKKLFLLAALCLFSHLTAQQSNAQNPIVFIYDASGSMWGQMEGKTKMQIASTVLSNTVEKLSTDQQLGLVAYGHRQKGDCKDVETLVGMNNTSKAKVVEAVENIKPLGKTPLAFSATMVIDQLRSSKTKATIILITDGIESCNGNICDVVKAAKSEGIDFKLHIVGFGLKDDETDQLKCAATEGGGNYYHATNAQGLGEVMSEAVSQTIDKKEGNHGIFAIKNGQAIDAWAKAYKSGTKDEMGGVRTYRDTGYVYLPTGKYDIVVQPLENSDVKPLTIYGVQTFEDRKTFQTVSFDAAKLLVNTTNNGEGWDATVAIEDAEGKNVAGGRTYGRTKAIEVNPGTYSVNLRALRIEGLETFTTIENLVVNANDERAVAHDFKSGNVEILPKHNGEIIDCTVKFKEIETGKQVAGGRTYDKGKEFILTPGTYIISVKALGANQNLGSLEKTFKVEAGGSEKITFSF